MKTETIQSSLTLPFTMYTIKLDLQNSSPVSTFLAATIRGGIGYALRSCVCSFMQENCSKCLLQHSCAYSLLFNSAPPPDAPRLKNYAAIPRPFAIYPQKSGSNISLSLLLIGAAAIKSLPYFIYALNILGKRGLGRNRVPFDVTEVWSPSETLVYTKGVTVLTEEYQGENLEIVVGSGTQRRITIEFVTPYILRQNDRIVSTIAPYPFFSSILRRITNLHAFYGENPTNTIDPYPFLACTKQICVTSHLKPLPTKRYSTRQKTVIDYTGMVGHLALEGELGPVYPLLAAGQVVGIGKNTVFGYGRYRMTDVA
ncbi:MAG: CRISPR system precrRNA processing endoribonuclease RAMP protein Cas6 [Chitinivibrionales bacterium]|nr:CRISPR system precrRNA processing endoribonuclease RAMP protein Cas6 [Chitinivibrionales bacterium]